MTKRLVASFVLAGNALALGILLASGRATATPPMDLLDALLADIDKLDREQRYERWREIDGLVQGDPAVRDRLLRIATGKVPMGRYQRFVASAQVAGFGLPAYCGPTAAMNMTLDVYLGFFRGFPKPGRTYHIDCEPDLKALVLDVASIRPAKRTVQDTLWDLIQRHWLDFRIRRDSTFYIYEVPP
jgi:hypothetical protein